MATAAKSSSAGKAREGREGREDHEGREGRRRPPGPRRPATASRGAKGTLVVVESPAKAKTIKKYLGRSYEVKASVGHVMDLPKSKLGVDVENGFEPQYVVIQGKTKVVSDIKKAARKAEHILLATDPDREGEAIAWHLAMELGAPGGDDRVQRVLFNEITKRAILAAIEKPGQLDRKKYDSQQARRILDRLVGYQISPILWKKVRRGLSAGRVQSVAVRLVVEREREIEAFVAGRVLDPRRRPGGGAAPRVPGPAGQGGRAEGRAHRRRDRHAASPPSSGRPASRSPRSTARSGAATRRRPSPPRSSSRRRPTGSASAPRRP